MHPLTGIKRFRRVHPQATDMHPLTRMFFGQEYQQKLSNVSGNDPLVNQPVMAERLGRQRDPVCVFRRPLGPRALLSLLKPRIPFPRAQYILRMMPFAEKLHLEILLERCPVAANEAVVGDDGLEDAPVVVSAMLVLWRQHDVATLIADQVLVVGWNQQVLPFAETPRATVVGQIEIPAW